MIELRERFLGVFRVGVLVVSVSVGVRGIEVLFFWGGGGMMVFWTGVQVDVECLTLGDGYGMQVSVM